MTEHPKCKTCGKALDSSSFMSVVRGYRTYCCTRCMHLSEEHSKHLSESYARNMSIDPDFSNKRA